MAKFAEVRGAAQGYYAAMPLMSTGAQAYDARLPEMLYFKNIRRFLWILWAFTTGPCLILA